MKSTYSFISTGNLYTDPVSPLTDIPVGHATEGWWEIASIANEHTRIQTHNAVVIVESKCSFDVDTLETMYSVTLMDDHGDYTTFTMPYAVAQEVSIRHFTCEFSVTAR